MLRLCDILSDPKEFNQSSAILDTARIIPACDGCMKRIEKVRAEELEKILSKYRTYSKMNWSTFKVEQHTRTDEEIKKWIDKNCTVGVRMDVVRAEDKFLTQYRVAQKLKNLAEMSGVNFLTVTSDDFYCISDWF